jgi:hypothetical protein
MARALYVGLNLLLILHNFLHKDVFRFSLRNTTLARILIGPLQYVD